VEYALLLTNNERAAAGGEGRDRESSTPAGAIAARREATPKAVEGDRNEDLSSAAATRDDARGARGAATRARRVASRRVAS